MSITIALAGNPNCGKTTMFNALTGANQFVGNWPGVTVEKKEGRLKGRKDVSIMDLPGIYSLSPYTLEEVVARNYLIQEKPDVILNLVDASNIERNLYLTTQLLELGIPVVIALNMMDVVRKNGDQIDGAKLSAALGCPVVETSAIKGEGCIAAAEKAAQVATAGGPFTPKHTFAPVVEDALGEIEGHISGLVPAESVRWYAVKLFEQDEKVLASLPLNAETADQVAAVVKTCETAMDDDRESIITNERYEYISKLVARCVRKGRSGLSLSDQIDRIVTNRWLALPIFAVVMYVVYYISISTVGDILTNWTNDTFVAEWIQAPLGGFLAGIGTADWLISLIVDGIVGGVGSVLGFVPQMLVLFLMLCILEDCGYMARVAFIMDRIFRRFGLSGKSFIPMLIGSGCGVPGIMASRTIEQDRDRKMTIMTTTFIPCGAKLPIIALIAAALFDGAWWVAPSAYFVGIAAIIISGIMLRKTRLFSGDPAPFVMELPNYRMPGAKNVLQLLWDKAKDFLQRAFTVIFLATIIVWFLTTFSLHLNMVTESKDSILAGIAGVIAPVFAPLGFGDWRISTALITGFIAKESVVSTLSILFGTTTALTSLISTKAAAALLVFCLLYTPCVAAIASIRRELGQKWAIGVVILQCAIAWVCAFAMYHLLMFL